MKHKTLLMKPIILIFLIAFGSLTGCSQNTNQKNNSFKQRVGGSCEGCEAIYESPVDFNKLSHIATLPDFNEQGAKLMISGIVYHRDGKTPAKDIVIYFYHTDQTGNYPRKGNETGWGKRHGHLRGWLKTNEKGEYIIYTLKPVAYPGRTEPAHIHLTIKEPDKNEYYIDDFQFDDDPLLTKEKRERQQNRGGDGIIRLKNVNGIWKAKRNIVLGLHVDDYPVSSLNTNIKSGLTIGSNCPAFDPLHLSGTDKGKTTCPMCKYGYGQGIMVWFNHTSLDAMKGFVKGLESEMQQRGEKKLRVFMVYMNPSYRENSITGQKILQGKFKEWCEAENLRKVAMVWVASPKDESCKLYKINPEAKNTVFVYKKRVITDKWINIQYDNETLKNILQKLYNIS